MSILKVNTIQDKGGNNLLVSDGAGTISSGGLMTMTPSFEANVSSDQSGSHQSNTKIQFDTKLFDTDNCYDTSNYRFTPTVAGKYYVYANALISSTSANVMDYAQIDIYKNGSAYKKSRIDPVNTADLNAVNVMVMAIIDFNGSTDYVEAFYYVDNSGGQNQKIVGHASNNSFGAYRIIGA